MMDRGRFWGFRDIWVWDFRIGRGLGLEMGVSWLESMDATGSGRGVGFRCKWVVIGSEFRNELMGQ